MNHCREEGGGFKLQKNLNFKVIKKNRKEQNVYPGTLT
jgi:hypothetical protein